MIIEKSKIPKHLLRYFKLKEKKTKVRKGYISHLCDIFDEYKEVLHNHGTLWVVIDDKYDDTKSLYQTPHKFSIEMANRGWRLINDIVWYKPNAYPESVSKRFSRDQEYVFLFVKNYDPLFWVNVKTGNMITESPLGTNGIEGKDWRWKVCNHCSGEGIIKKQRTIFDKTTPPEKECTKCKGIGKRKKTLWKMFDYFFEQQFEPLSEESVKDLRRRKK